MPGRAGVNGVGGAGGASDYGAQYNGAPGSNFVNNTTLDNIGGKGGDAGPTATISGGGGGGNGYGGGGGAPFGEVGGGGGGNFSLNGYTANGNNGFAGNDKDPDYLNVVKSKNNSINGVMFKTDEKELIKLKRRELEYNMELVDIYDFLTHKKIGKGFLFVDNFIRIDKSKKKPQKSYFILCREAAYHISREFGEYWDKTTYTSNKKNIKDFLKKNKKYNTILQR